MIPDRNRGRELPGQLCLARDVVRYFEARDRHRETGRDADRRRAVEMEITLFNACKWIVSQAVATAAGKGWTGNGKGNGPGEDG